MMLTIFTPTYNRAHLLPRLYESLIAQKNQNFEWLVVDDGSVDDTETYISRIQTESNIKIRYVKKENGGKHTAHNEALKRAKGDWFLCLDSDDVLAPNAIKLIEWALNRMTFEKGVVAYKSSTDGTLLCGEIPIPKEPQTLYQYSKIGGGEYALIFSTEILKSAPFPEIPGERFITECVVYDQLDLTGHRFAVLPETLEICEYQADGLSNAVYDTMLRNPTGYQIYHAQRIDLVTSFRERLRHAISYQAFLRLSGRDNYLYGGRHKLLAALAWLPGQLGAMYYKKKGTC